MDKQTLRKKMLNLRGSINNPSMLAKSACDNLFSSEIWQKADGIAVFVSYRDEFPTASILEEAWKQNKQVAVPKVTNRQQREMVFVSLTQWNDLVPGYMGIPEPSTSKGTEIDSRYLMLMPGLAFDFHGYRLGYGGGFYDTFLASLKKDAPVTVGLCYSCQIVDNVPHNIHDVPVDAICSDLDLRWVEK